MEENDENLNSGQEKFLNVVGFVLAIFFLINLYGFLTLFFKIVLPNFGKGTFFHYVKLIIVLSIAASVIETLRRRQNFLLWLSFTLLLLIVNVFSIWRNWYYH